MLGTMSDVGSKNKWSYPNISPKFYQNIPPALSGADVSNSVRPRRDSNGHYLMRVILNIILNRKVLRNHHLSFSVEIQNVPCIMRWDWLKVGSGKPGQQHNGAVLSNPGKFLWIWREKQSWSNGQMGHFTFYEINCDTCHVEWSLTSEIIGSNPYKFESIQVFRLEYLELRSLNSRQIYFWESENFPKKCTVWLSALGFGKSKQW